MSSRASSESNDNMHRVVHLRNGRNQRVNQHMADEIDVDDLDIEVDDTITPVKNP